MTEERFRTCALVWGDGWGDHTCHLTDGHDGDHRCTCDATLHEWTHEDEDAMLNDRHRAEARDGWP